MSKSSKTTHPADLIDQFICGNAVDVMQSIADSSIDLVVTSPPYNLKNSTGNGMKNGNLYIDFDARTGHNHGTKFRLRSKVLINLYAEVKKY